LSRFTRYRIGLMAFVSAAALVFAAVALAVTKTKTFGTGSISKPIADQDVLFQKINVGAQGRLKDLNVAVRADHTQIEDLTLLLESPRGKVIKLFTNAVSGGDLGSGADSCGGDPTVFDDEATTNVESGTAPLAGSFRPEQSLSKFDGKPIHGRWRLIVSDGDGGDDGTLFCAKLQMKYSTG
jgi:subtilisin-like proprotein convertase family protein